MELYQQLAVTHVILAGLVLTLLLFIIDDSWFANNTNWTIALAVVMYTAIPTIALTLLYMVWS